MKLLTTLANFEERCKALAQEGKDLCTKEPANIERLAEFVESIVAWHHSVETFLQHSFDEQGNAIYLAYSQINTPLIANNKVNFGNFNDIKEGIQTKVLGLITAKEFLRELDMVVNPDDPEMAKRKEFAITQKEELLLKKLYHLYPKGKFYPVKVLLEYNGIQLNSDDEDIKIAGPMQKMGQLDLQETPYGIAAKITEGGVKYVEETLLRLNNELLNIPDGELETIFDGVLDELNKQGLMQEIVYDEINDLRQIVGKLTAKQWREMLMGKLVELGVESSVKNDTLKIIYERLTLNEVVRGE